MEEKRAKMGLLFCLMFAHFPVAEEGVPSPLLGGHTVREVGILISVLLSPAGCWSRPSLV